MLALKEIAMWVILVLTGLGVTYTAGYTSGTAKVNAAHTKELKEALEEKEKIREDYQQYQTGREEQWRKESQMVASAASGIVDDLHSRNIRLSVKLADVTVASVTDSNQCRADGRAELHRETAEFLIGEAQRADSQVKALQDTVRNLQGKGGAHHE